MLPLDVVHFEEEVVLEEVKKTWQLRSALFLPRGQ